MSTYKKIAGFMPEKISSDEVAKNNAAVEASTKDQTDAAIAALSRKNTASEEKMQDFKPFSFENAPVYKSLNQEENSEQDNQNEQKGQGQNFAQNGQTPADEQVQPKVASPLIPSIPKPPVNNLQNNAPQAAGAASGFNRTNNAPNPNVQNAQNFAPERNAPNAGSFGNGGNPAGSQNFSNYQNAAAAPQTENGANAMQPVPYQPVPYVDPNSANSQTENLGKNVPAFNDFQNNQNFQQAQTRQNEQTGQMQNFAPNGQNFQPEQNARQDNAPFMPSIPKPPVNNLQNNAAQTAGFASDFNRTNNAPIPNVQNAQNFAPEQNAPGFSGFGSGGNPAGAPDFSNYQNAPAVPQAESGENAQSFLDYQNQAQALQNQGAQAFANLRSALNENYKNTLQNVVQNQQPPAPQQPAQPAQTEVKTGANPVPYKAVPYMASSPSGNLPRYQADDEEQARKPDVQPVPYQPPQAQNSQNAQNVQNNWQPQKQNTAPKKGFWQKLQDAFAPAETEPRAPNLNEPVNLRAPENASRFNQNYAAQTLRNMQNTAQNEQTAAKNQQEWADLSRQIAESRQNQQNYSQITNARSAIGESAREIIPPKDAEGTQFDFAAFAAKQSGSAFEAKKFSVQPLEAFYVKKQAQDNAEKNRNTVNIPNIKTTDGGFAKSDNIFYKIPAGTKDSNARRVAKFLLLIGTDEAAKIIAQLPQEQVEKIVPEIASIRRVEPEEKAQILAEFQGLMTKARESGGVTTARTILEKAFGDQQAQDIMQRAVPYDGGKPFDYLQKFDGEQLTLVLKDESVPVKALVLSQVKPAVAAAVINQMNEKERKETVLRLSRLTKFSPDILSRIDRTLREKAENVKTPVSNSIDGRGALASILRKMDANSEKNILSNLSLVDGELESDLRKRLFTIDDVIAADDKFLQKKLHAMTDDTIAMIIHGKQPEFRKKILNNISKTRGISVLEEEDARAPYSKKELDRLTNEFMNMLRAAWEKGELMINNGDEEWV